MKRGDKKGLSTVIVTLILIGLGIVAVVLVWAVIGKTISEGSNEVELGKFTINLKIEKVIINDGSVEITVKRDVGRGEISGLNIVFFDGAQQKIVKVNSLDLGELTTKKFTVDYPGIIKSVGVAPLLKSDSDSVVAGKIQGTIEYSGREAIENMPGLVSWWRFEGNAQDEVGDNNGVANGATQTDGKFGKAYAFDGADDYINITNDVSLQLENSNFTIATWVYLNDYTAVWKSFVTKGNIFNFVDGYGLATLNDAPFFGTRYSSAASTNTLSSDNWYHITGTHDFNNAGNTIIKIYINGDLDREEVLASTSSTLTNDHLLIGTDENIVWDFNGKIDEFMIFNTTLSEDDILALYNLDLS